jgi:CMP-N,N'-diacetyllegionaminic acid synthase
MKPLVIIPARSGSKGIPGKNWKLLNGKPLIQYTLEVAIDVFAKDQICVSTDSSEIVTIAQQLGIHVPFLRPTVLASDTAGSQDVLLHALDHWEKYFYSPNMIILLQPTSPFRKSFHIKEAILNYKPTIDMVLGVKETKANPYYVLREEDEYGYLKPSKVGNFTRRQDCPKVYEVNGAIYIINPVSLRNNPMQCYERIVKYEMDEISSHDIDDKMDWLVAETILRNNTL